MAAASSSSALPDDDAMASSAPCRYKEGSRVQMVTNGREKGKQRWVKADVYRIEEGSGRTALHLREVGGHQEELKQVVPHSKTTTSPHGQQGHGGFRLTHKNSADQDDNRMAPGGLGDDHLSCVFSFMTPRELSAVPTLCKQWPQVKGAFHQQTHITIDSSTEGDRHFWESLTPEQAFQLGKWLVNLTAITLVQPRRKQWWCLGSMISIVEGHAAGRRAACEKEGQQLMAEGSLETIDFTTATDQLLNSTTSPRPPVFRLPPPTEPPTIHALRAVTGAVGEHYYGKLADRGWKMPALERVHQDGWDAKQLGRFVSSSQSLKEVEGRRRSWEWWAAVFEHFPIASARQPGPLRQLQTIGGIAYEGFEGEVRRLQDVLTSRGCRKSLRRLDVGVPRIEGHHSLSALLAVDDFINTCCTSPDVPLTVNVTPSEFDLSLFYADEFPLRPSPFIKAAIQEAARQTTGVTYTISQNDLTHPIDSPSQAAGEIASSLSFDNVSSVMVHDANGFDPPPGTTPPAPDIINHLQPIPRVHELCVWSAVGGAAGRLLAQKMPMEVEWVVFHAAVSAQDRLGVLEGLGEEREVGIIDGLGDAVGEVDPVTLTEELFDGWGSNRLPSISNIGMRLAVPHEMEASAAANIIRDGLSSLLTAGVRGLRRVWVWLPDEPDDLVDGIRELLPDGTRVGGFTINTRDDDDFEDGYIAMVVATRDP
ncbi:unnamed protein product [Vitrella brassicaformis CCMP3155]|uniref:Uncharacterized protein n=1 Tax=Vitrella brassicaformis (strain CCMP3155) TaxID=1169540 RepID=A0A0G4EQN1_VITBC|nr:unnamed protein product [Vitrella brassicaformis CCMP3155]|eukprot:CEL99772.1 unnamed protein product [Vitrella brassicaformis CCMP3155]